MIGYLMESKVLVKWRMAGSLVRDGLAQHRVTGDEDIVSPREARRLSICGLCEIVGSLDEIGKSRRLSDSTRRKK
jgi:hypothetical protein